MPVKVRCRGCEHQFSVPDAARGKSVKCKECGAPVKIPAGDADSKKKKPEKSIEDEDFFSQLDLENVDHEEKRICPKCTQDVSEEDIECPHCGVNLETGQISNKQKEKQKIKRRGPDPDQFFKVVWSNSKEFVLAKKGLAIRLGMFWSFATTLHTSSAFMSVYCEKVPLKVFFGVFALIAGLAAIGCFYQLAIEIIRQTREETDKYDRFAFDFFGNIALGLKAVCWPFALYGIVLFPLAGIVAGLVKREIIAVEDVQLPAAIIGGCAFLFALPMLPTALCHLTGKYTYKAYLPNEMFRITAKNAGAVAYWWLIVFAMMFVAFAAAVPIGIFSFEIWAQLTNVIFKVLELCGIDVVEENRGFLFYVVFPVIGMLFLWIFYTLYSFTISFSSMYAMRAVGLLCYYNQHKLQMGDKRVAGQSAPFWIRYLAYIIDQTLLAIFLVFVFLASFLFNKFLVDGLGVEGMTDTLAMVTNFVVLLLPFGYYILSESGPGGGTLGKLALGLEVVNKDGKRPITTGEAMMRAILRNIGAGLFGLGLAMCAWDPEKRTLHDKSTKTRVVWRPENY